MQPSSYDSRVCILGEGPLWHPKRNQLFWFDILTKRLLSREGGAERTWQFEEFVSAAGWIDEETLIIASESGLYEFDIASGARRLISAIEADDNETRSNDGRGDPYGGFWVGTMGKQAQHRAGAIYRWYRGELRKLFSELSVPNSICFAPDGKEAFFCDTREGVILRVQLDMDGWPKGQASTFVSVPKEDGKPDGAVVDADGDLWNAQWGGSRVARYASNGQLRETISFPTRRISCPAFGGPDLSTLYVTSAVGEEKQDEYAGQTFAVSTSTVGQAEHQVKR